MRCTTGGNPATGKGDHHLQAVLQKLELSLSLGILHMETRLRILREHLLQNASFCFFKDTYILTCMYILVRLTVSCLLPCTSVESEMGCHFYKKKKKFLVATEKGYKEKY